MSKAEPMNSSNTVVGILYNRYEPLAGRPEDVQSERAVEAAARQADEALQTRGYRTDLFPLSRHLPPLIEWLHSRRTDVVVNLCEGFRGHPAFEPHLAAVLELMEVPFTGNTCQAITQCLDKFKTKAVLRALDLPTPEAWLVGSAAQLPDSLPFPLIVKPNAEDASIGIRAESVVADRAALGLQVEQSVARYRQPALVERYVEGRELNVAVIADPRPRVLPVSEITFVNWPEGEPRIVGYEAKWDESHPAFQATVGVCPAAIPDDLRGAIERMALRLWQAFGLRGYARIDGRLDAAGRFFILEINPNPDTSRDAGLARALRAAGIAYEDFWRAQVLAAAPLN